MRQWPRSGTGEPRGTAAQRRGSAGVWGATARGRGRCQDPPRARAGRGTSRSGSWAPPGLRESTGSGRGAGGRTRSSQPSWGGVRGRSAGDFTPAARRAGGLGAGQTFSPPSSGRDWGRRAGWLPSAVGFLSLPAAAAGDEDGGAGAERPGPPGVTVAPSGFPALPNPPGPGPGVRREGRASGLGELMRTRF